MASLLERLRNALGPKYTLEREIASGGMGVVFLGENTSLRSHVAIKVLRPELATAAMEARFQREARLLAQLSHPNIVTIHDVDIADGVHYYVMDYIEGETLAERLERGPMEPDDVLSLGRDLLSALEAVHKLNVVHRDIKPANIFVVEGRALLVDFGIAHVDHTESDATLTGQGIGTPAYMPPEQRVGSIVTSQTDLYSLGMVLYECSTGNRWEQSDDSEEGNWVLVPQPLARALRKALKQDPKERWANATDFYAALIRKSHYEIPRVAAPIGAIAVTVAVAALIINGCPPPPEEVDLAIRPFTVTGSEAQTALGVELSVAVRDLLMPIPQLKLEGVDHTSSDHTAPLQVEGNLARRGDQWVLSWRLQDSAGMRYAGVDTTSSDLPYDLADGVALETVKELKPRFVGHLCRDSISLPAIGEYLRGQIAFQKDHWKTADDHFTKAIARDSRFKMAAWWRFNARKLGRRPVDLDSLQAIFSREKACSPLDQLLIDARLEPRLTERLELFDEAIGAYPSRYYAALFRGVELFHRGALAGHQLNEALRALESAILIDSLVGWPHNQLIWAYIRHGQEAKAANALRQRRQVTTEPAPGDPNILALFEWANQERFNRAAADRFLEELLKNPDNPLLEDVGMMLRLASSLDLPGIQIVLGTLMAEDSTRTLDVRANGNTGRGLAFIMTGRPVTGVHMLDAASIMWATREQQFLAEEMRLMLPAFGIPIPPVEVDSARSRVESFLDDSALGIRAAWALANDARQRGDADAARQWRRRVTSKAKRGPYRLPLDTLLLALEDAEGGDFQGALQRSGPLIEIDSAGRGSDPFARALLYWHRARWREALGDEAGAEREWLWYENADFGPWPAGEVQPAEIDWMLGTYARLNRARVQLSLANREAEACKHLIRVAELWAEAETAILPKKAEADSLFAERCVE